MSPYEILGLAPGASLEEAKRVHRRLVMRYHPDRPEGNVVKFREVREAYNRIAAEKGASHLTRSDGPGLSQRGGFGSAVKQGTKISPW